MRKREISPDFFTDERVVQLSEAAQMLFIGLWCLADRNGVLIDNPITIKLKILPARSYGVDDLLTQIADLDLIRRYQVDDLRLIFLPGFAKHQRIHPREMAGKLPLPPKAAAKRREIPPGPSGSSGSSGPSGSIGPFGTDAAAERRGPDPEPPTPKTGRNWQLEFFEEAQITRVRTLARDSITVPAEAVSAAWISTTFRRIALEYQARFRCEEIDARMGVLRVWDAYLAETWPAETEPPYAFRGFASKKVWPKLLEQLPAPEAEAPEEPPAEASRH